MTPLQIMRLFFASTPSSNGPCRLENLRVKIEKFNKELVLNKLIIQYIFNL
jgi:hypothetical protein